jgi:hypothetical protein
MLATQCRRTAKTNLGKKTRWEGASTIMLHRLFIFTRKTKSRSNKPMARRARFEPLERRQLLSASPLFFGNHMPAPGLSLVIRPDDIFEVAGATPLTGTVYRSGPTTGQVNVSVTISDPNSELVSDAAIPVTIPAGMPSATFTLPLAKVDATPDGTTSIVKFTATDTSGVLSPSSAKAEVIDPVVTVKVQPDDIVESPTAATTASINGTVSLNTGPVAADTAVSIAITDPGKELVSDAAVSVTILKGSSSAMFQVPIATDTSPDGTVQAVTLTPTLTGYFAKAGTAELIDPQVKVSLPKSILETSTAMKTGFVSVNTPASGNTSGLTVTLAASVSGELNLPTTVTIPAGQTSASFTFTSANDDTTLDGTTPVTVTPTLAGYFGKTSTIQVVDPEVSVHLNPSTLVEAAGNTGTGYVSINTGPVAADTVVTLAGSDAGKELNLPATVTIPAGSSSVKFIFTPVVDATADAPVTVTVTPTLAGFFSETASIQVVDPTLTVRIEPGTISEAAGANPSSAYGVVTLNTPVPAADTNGLTINLTETVGGSASTEVTIPATVTIPAGERHATFKITTVPDATSDPPVIVTVKATDPSGFAAAGSGTVTVVDQALILGVHVFPGTISEAAGAKPATGIVTLNAPAPTTLTIHLTETVGGSPSTEVTIPATVTIPAGQRFATFTVTPVADATADPPITVTITATDPTNSAATGSTTVNVVDSLPPGIQSGGEEEGGDDNDSDHGFQTAVDAVFAHWGGDN